MLSANIILAPDVEAAKPLDNIKSVEQKLSAFETLWGIGALRKTLLILTLAIVWQVYASYLDNPLLFPTLSDTIITLVDRFADGTLPARIWTTLQILFMGYALGTVLAALLTVLAINTRIGTDFLETMTAMFNPLPAISLLPLALIWFGLGASSLVFVLVHSVLWAVALNTHSGFLGVSRTLRMVGANYGLTGISYVLRILVPAAFPSILTGLKIGWAFAWRTLIAAELVFGVSSGQGGLGWFIFENRNLLDIPAVFAGLLTVIIIGLIVENLVFQTIERHTIQKWGMKE
ncbi:nitrate/sulfonate/bicarbonate ABC transporter permease protein (plasmid) [Rhizobium phaseoli]|uniref:ABC transporter permease n=1 Tax=Rhizobium phaseoli TaxID=396 RepID=UPI0007EAFCF6|nr:ABC transporter permease [Rhizobium phaseoli]ANL67973.1 nitrate/sulfonate/bicarbonate ABC transporter permease protein [Rhizobium phaseoli]ANL80787.1 nitrate/sulfonate/bicarbonate ABC transporter permease protein [Rhizobium phaseoli]PCD66399.1 ABC transporter permease [Rhizobium phaseoli]